MRISDYPFTHWAAEHVRQAGFSLESLVGRPLFRQVRARAAERVLGAIAGAIPERHASTDAEHLAELLSYPLARVMVSCLGDPILLRRYALAEAKLASRRMQGDLEGLMPLANDLGLHPEVASTLRLHFSEYVRAAHRMRDPKWKLVNRDLRGGYLTVTEEELRRLLEEAVRERVLTGLPLPVDESICEQLSDYIRPVQSELQRLKEHRAADLGRVEEGAFPPCIRRLISEVEAGTNLAHSARFALVSFLLRINMSLEDVMALFATSPDFDEDRTRYQVEHIAGASGTRYSPPSCATMATYGNCPGEDELCRRIRHPLGYYERRLESLHPSGPGR
ncbi:MAG: DNA primase large subunit PriL [Methanothrix sp.]|nr:DNA primase large subunit PriL [Methanothrix sp.]